MGITLHKNDLPDDLDLGSVVAIDTETMGLRPARDRLCLIQLSSGDGNAHLVQVTDYSYPAPNLKNLLTDASVKKLMHFARFDVAILMKTYNVHIPNLYCTKIASKLTRTYTDKHGLAHLCRELLGVELSKQYQSSDWGNADLGPEQLSYAANDVYYLHRIRDRLDSMLEREGRTALAQSCFDFLETRARLDLDGWETDIFEH